MLKVYGWEVSRLSVKIFLINASWDFLNRIKNARKYIFSFFSKRRFFQKLCQNASGN